MPSVGSNYNSVTLTNGRGDDGGGDTLLAALILLSLCFRSASSVCIYIYIQIIHTHVFLHACVFISVYFLWFDADVLRGLLT